MTEGSGKPPQTNHDSHPVPCKFRDSDLSAWAPFDNEATKPGWDRQAPPAPHSTSGACSGRRWAGWNPRYCMRSARRYDEPTRTGRTDGRKIRSRLTGNVRLTGGLDSRSHGCRESGAVARQSQLPIQSPMACRHRCVEKHTSSPGTRRRALAGVFGFRIMRTAFLAPPPIRPQDLNA